MIKKVALRIAVFFLATYNFAISQTDFEKAKVELVKLRDEFAKDNSPGDILFLVDTTSSLSNYAFQAEKIFIEGFLNTITVSVKAVRVELIPFDSPQVSSYIDQVSNPTSAKNKCTFGEKMIQMHHTYGWATNTKGAFQQAYDVCLRKQKRSVKTVVILLMDGYWNYPQGDPSPVLIAQKLHTQAVEVYAIGIWRPDKFKLSALVKNPAKQAFLLENFNQLRELAFYLRGDPGNPKLQPVTSDKCNNICDPIATCSCDLVGGFYSCQCPEGHVGSGLVGNCFRSPGKK